MILLHHKLEKWITKIMIEKNKKIRLEAARKTIAKLEPASAKASAGKRTSADLSSKALATDETSAGKPTSAKASAGKGE